MWRSAEYERVAPAVCERCGGTAFERHGGIGLWDGARGGGRIYEAKCLGCRVAWRSNSDPFTCRDAPQSLRWYPSMPVKPFYSPTPGPSTQTDSTQ